MDKQLGSDNFGEVFLGKLIGSIATWGWVHTVQADVQLSSCWGVSWNNCKMIGNAVCYLIWSRISVEVRGVSL